MKLSTDLLKPVNLPVIVTLYPSQVYNRWNKKVVSFACAESITFKCHWMTLGPAYFLVWFLYFYHTLLIVLLLNLKAPNNIICSQ